MSSALRQKTRVRVCFELAGLALLLNVAVVQSGVYNLLSNGYLCINAGFTVTYSLVSKDFTCALMCDDNPRCQAFTTVDGQCQLFVFDKCSKSVKNCSCSRTGPVFVKQQLGLQPGALCPSGYTDDLCGVKYKMYSGIGYWSASRQKCESESGLVIMTDVVDSAELDLIDVLYTKYGNVSYWVGGYQAPGSTEPDGGWYWVSCNINLASFVWGANEPNNGVLPNENTTGRWWNRTKLSDFNENSGTPQGVLCECVSPFG